MGIPNSNPCRIIANTDENKYEEGYDSDGAIGPFYDAVAGEVDIDAFVDDVDLGLPESMGGDGTDAAPDPNKGRSWFIEDSEIMKLHLEGEGGLKKTNQTPWRSPKRKEEGLTTNVEGISRKENANHQ